MGEPLVGCGARHPITVGQMGCRSLGARPALAHEDDDGDVDDDAIAQY